jgi:hypothetical protein
MKRGGTWDKNPEYRERQAWPAGVRFENARAERVIDQRMPPRPTPEAYGSSGAMCVGARFAESELDGRLSP